MSGYRCRVTIGGVVWGDVHQGDAPDYGIVLPLTFGWRVPENSLGFPAQPEPSTATLNIIIPTGPDAHALDLGMPVWVQFWADADDTDTYAEFSGRVLEVTAAPHDLGMLVEVQCVDYLRDLADVVVGDSDWPAEKYADRLARIFTEAGAGFAWTTGGGSPTDEHYEPARDTAGITALVALTDLLDRHILDGGLEVRYRGILAPNIDDTTGQLATTPWALQAYNNLGGGSVSVPGHLLERDVAWTRTRNSYPDHVTIITDALGAVTYNNGSTNVAHPPVSIPTMYGAGLDVLGPYSRLGDWLLSIGVPGDPFYWDAGKFRVLADRDPSVCAHWFPHSHGNPVDRPFEFHGLDKWVYLEDLSPDWVPRDVAGHPTDPIAGRLSSADLTLDAGGRWFVDFTLRKVAYR